MCASQPISDPEEHSMPPYREGPTGTLPLIPPVRSRPGTPPPSIAIVTNASIPDMVLAHKDRTTGRRPGLRWPQWKQASRTTSGAQEVLLHGAFPLQKSGEECLQKPEPFPYGHGMMVQIIFPPWAGVQ